MATEGMDIAEARERVDESSVEEGGELGAVQFEEGFTGKTILGALFVGFVMLPGALYLGLVAGAGLGPAAEWVTIVLFAEVMRRSFLPMKRQEIYMLYYVAAMLANVLLQDRGISGGPFGYLIWNQYFRQAPQAQIIARDIPNWVVPAAGSSALVHRTFFDWAWAWPIALLVFGEVVGRLNWLSMGYVLFRVTSDVEKLPFPMAPVAASGATALAEAASKEESWRWRVFSIGTVVGLVFGFFYVAIPIFTGVVFNKALTLIPIPFIDLTQNTETILPGAVTGISGDLGNAMTGFVLPYPVVAGAVVGAVFTHIFPMPNILHSLGVFGDASNSGWVRGMDAFYTKQTTDIKFWMSVNIGLQVAIAIIGVVYVIGALRANARAASGRGLFAATPRGRGDVAMWIPISIWFGVTTLQLLVCWYLLGGKDGHAAMVPWPLLIFFGYLWTPLNSFVSARMVGMTGSPVTFPYLKEISVMKTGYPFVDIWYAPIPLADYGLLAQRFREVELTGTRFSSVVKAEFFVLPIFLVSSFIFWAFFWHTSPIPSSQHPYAQRFWPLQATFQALFQSINQKGGPSWVREAISAPKIVGGTAVGLALFGVTSLLRLPALFYYGMIGGVNLWPANVIPQFFGAWLGRRYFAKRYGVEQWTLYAPVLLAGFACGTGLVSMAAIALALIAKSVNYLPF